MFYLLFILLVRNSYQEPACNQDTIRDMLSSQLGMKLAGVYKRFNDIDDSFMNVFNEFHKINIKVQSLEENVFKHVQHTPLLTRCNPGFFRPIGSMQCFKIFQDVNRSWIQAKIKCEEAGLKMAKPLNFITAVALRKYLLDTYGDGEFWFGAKGDESKMVWNNGMELRKDDLLWWPRSPDQPGSNRCLSLLVMSNELQQHPGRPYAWRDCETPLRTPMKTLCEEIEDTNGRCPIGFFTLHGSKECYKIFKDVKRTFSQAREICMAEDLQMTKPSDFITAVTLRKYLLDTYGDVEVWLGAQGDGSKIVWNNSMELRKDNPLWWPGHPDQLSSDWCLSLLVWSSDLYQHPGRPYGVRHCETPLRPQYTLCQMVN